MAYKDPEKQKQAQAQWYQDNKERLREERRTGVKRESHRAANRKSYVNTLPVTLLRNARKRAKAYDREFSITLEDIVVPERCPVLGMPLRVGEGNRNHDDSPTLDRTDNTKGYIPGNVQVISYRANRIKSDATADEVQAVADWMKRVLQ